ncbi:unnamed protein product [Peronospora farinosa]|uniref:Uncharacterized protein n=1 Tax=Peronospora farinosa TaxID=134698 RepID=A0AAV0URB1_9STRA|nr:unnamed protein product [Peronospora farinosa]CAI5739415.1 unnamed protein product [Peronospora farinosa]
MALESIPDEDRYFRPSRYVLARIVYWLSTFYSTLDLLVTVCWLSWMLCELIEVKNSCRVLCRSSKGTKEKGSSIFDKRRPLIVTIWSPETIQKYEEMNQRQMKYDYYRLKYWRFSLCCFRRMQLSCFMRVASQFKEMLDTLEGAGGIGGSGDDASTQTQLHGESRSVDGLFKQLAKTYTYYLEVFHAQRRLTHAIDDYDLLLKNAELPMVAVFFVGVFKYPFEVMVLEKDAAILDGVFHANVTVIKEALRRDDLRLDIYDAQGDKSFKKSTRSKANAAAAVTFVIPNTTDVRQSTTNG